MEILNWIVDVVTLALDAGFFFNFYKLFLSLFANAVNFLETLHFLKACCKIFQAEMKQAFAFYYLQAFLLFTFLLILTSLYFLLFPTSKAMLSSGSY